MARISVENDAYLQKIKNFIEPMLNQEKIVSLYRSQSSHSVYICLRDRNYYHLVLRLSDHSGGYDRAFQEIDPTHNDLAIKTHIHQALYREDAWVVINPRRHAIMKLIQFFRENNYRVFIPTTRKQKYAYIIDCNESAKPQTRFKLNEGISKELRTLTRMGFLSTTGSRKRQKNRRNEIYLPPLAHDILQNNEKKKDYDKYWMQNYQNQLNLNDIHDPHNRWLFVKHK